MSIIVRTIVVTGMRWRSADLFFAQSQSPVDDDPAAFPAARDRHGYLTACPRRDASLQSAAALPWLRTAPGPPPSTAAIHRPR